jgi:integrase
MWLPLLAATRGAHQLLHPLPLPTLPICYCLNSAQRSRLSRCCRVAQPTDPGWPSLARRPYDLRHARLSAWLNGGVYPTQVADWAGHSVEVLLRIYAKCVVGQDELAKHRISEALRQD